MSNVQEIRLCPKCRSMLKGTICSTCGLNTAAIGKSPYSSPDYIYYQRKDVKRDSTVCPLCSKNTKNDFCEHCMRDWRLEEVLRWFKNCPDEDRIGAMEDALNTVRYLMYGKCSGDITKQIITIGKKIGDLSLAFDNYMSKGGYIETYNGNEKQVAGEESLREVP